MRNFRVVLRDGQYAVHEVFLNDEGRVVGCTQDPVSPTAETMDALAAELKKYQLALKEPALDFTQLQSQDEQKRQTTG